MYIIHIYKASRILPENCSSDIASTSLQQTQSMSLRLSSTILACASFYLSNPKVFPMINQKDVFLLSLTAPSL